MKTLGFLFASAFTVGSLFSFAQKPAPSGYDPGIRPDTPQSVQAEADAEAAWFSHLQVLASDKLNGRRTGTPDFLHAVEYVEAQFKAAGLKPAGTEGYRQAVGFKSISTDAAASSFEIVKPGGQTTKLTVGNRYRSQSTR